MFLVGKDIEAELEVTNFMKELASLSDQDFNTKIACDSSVAEVDEFTQKLFNLHAFSTNEEIEEYFKSLNFQADKTDFFIKQLQSWRRNESALKVVNDSERENLVDLHWKLVARAGGTEDEKLYVQVELVVERNEQLKKYNLELDIPKFYNLLQELTKANHSLQEIFRR